MSGRTYPVEVRYRPLAADSAADAEDEDDAAPVDRDPVDAIGDAVEELLRDGPGDVLVFLSGEREIRDTAEALTGRLRVAASRSCRSTRASPRRSSSASSSRTTRAASCSRRTSPRRR